MIRTVALALIAALAIPLAARPAIGAPTIRAEHAVSRPALAGGNGIVYLDLTSARDDALLGAGSPIAAHTELHESTTGMTGMSGMGPMTSMKPLARLALPAGHTVRLAPGGPHLMLVGLRHDLHRGQRFVVMLRFAHGPPLRVLVPVHSY